MSSGVFPPAGKLLFLNKLPCDLVSKITEISHQEFSSKLVSVFNKVLNFCENHQRGTDGWFWDWEKKNYLQRWRDGPCRLHEPEEESAIQIMGSCIHTLEFSIPRITIDKFPSVNHFDLNQLLEYGLLKSLTLRPEDVYRSEIKHLFGKTVFDLIKSKLRHLQSLFIEIISSPPEWISATTVQPAIHAMFISSDKHWSYAQKQYWPGNENILKQVDKWRAYVQVKEWHWRDYPRYVLHFKGKSQMVFLHHSIPEDPQPPFYQTNDVCWGLKFEAEETADHWNYDHTYDHTDGDYFANLDDEEYHNIENMMEG